MQGPEAVKQTVLSAWAAYLDCPEVATQAINFAAIDWPAEQARGAVNFGERGGLPAAMQHQHAAGSAVLPCRLRFPCCGIFVDRL